MKKLFLFAIIALGCVSISNVYAEDPQNILLQIIDEGSTGHGNGKSPTLPLYITQNGNVLTLPTTPVDYTLQLRDEYDNVVYSSYIPAGTTQIVLPSTLSGDFEIRLVADTYYYIGYISL